MNRTNYIFLIKPAEIEKHFKLGAAQDNVSQMIFVLLERKDPQYTYL